MNSIRVGAPYRFKPAAFCGERDCGIPTNRTVEVTGRIAGINYAHRYFWVRYEVYGYTLYESFKF